MHDNFIHNCGNLFRLAQRYLLAPSSNMKRETLQDDFAGGNAVSRFVTPIAVMLAAASLVASLLWSDGINLASSVYAVLTSAISPYMVYYLIFVGTCKVLPRFGIDQEIEDKARIVTLQLILLYFVVTFLSTILPGARLLTCLYIYAFYLLWLMAGEFLGISDNRRLGFMLTESALCALALVSITFIINYITPKHP